MTRMADAYFADCEGAAAADNEPLDSAAARYGSIALSPCVIKAAKNIIAIARGEECQWVMESVVNGEEDVGRRGAAEASFLRDCGANSSVFLYVDDASSPSGYDDAMALQDESRRRSEPVAVLGRPVRQSKN